MDIHPAANIFPLIADDELATLAEDIKQNGLAEPVQIWGPGGPVIDGRNRIRACELAGIKVHTRTVIPTANGDDPVAYVLSLNLHRRHLTTGQRAAVAADLATMKRGDNQHAQNCATSQADAAGIMNVSRGSLQSANAVRSADPELHEQVKRGEVGLSEAVRAVKPHVANNSGNNEWYTPEPYIDAARAVMGGIDVDPASNPVANNTVKADEFYTKDDSGLDHDWTGRVWMNPPYASGLIGKFADKFAFEVMSGNTTDAIVLVNNATETVWFTTMASVASALCFPRGRVKFWNPDGDSAAPLQGQCILYCGNRTDLFTEEFSAIGLVCLIEAGQ